MNRDLMDGDMVDGEMIETGPRELMQADRAATSSLRMAFLSFFVMVVAIWITNFYGALAFYLGLILWLVLWILAIVVAVSALRNAYTSDYAVLVRKRAIVALIVTAINVVLVTAFTIAVTT